MITVDYPDLLQLFPRYLDPTKRSESASFLIWYLENYFRLDELEAVDSVCDQRGDKGIDGIYFSEGEGILYVFQSKISHKAISTVGDSDLRTFYGAMAQVRTRENIDVLLNGTGNELLKDLLRRIDVQEKLADCEVRGVFLANIDIDSNGLEYLKQVGDIKFIGKSDLISEYVSAQRNLPIDSPMSFDVSGSGYLEYSVDDHTKCFVSTVKATEIIRLPGIQNQSLFDLNVRGPLGKTKVNRDIEATLKNPEMHKTFPFYHNGITIICNDVQITGRILTINNYFVVNGCQSLTVLYRNANLLTNDLQVLVRIVLLDFTSGLSEKITTISNNQNGVKNRDFKSNHILQVRLQNEIATDFAGRYQYEVKRGEILSAPMIISNEQVGLQLIAFDLKEPWTTHRSYQVFDDKYLDIFARPEVTAHRLVLVDKLFRNIEAKIDKIENRLFGRYVLTKYLILFILRRLFENDKMGQKILANPKLIFSNHESEEKFDRVVNLILNDIVIDINEETKVLDQNFDYRGKLRDKEYVLNFTSDIVASYEKQIVRGRVPSIYEEWNK